MSGHCWAKASTLQAVTCKQELASQRSKSHATTPQRAEAHSDPIKRPRAASLRGGAAGSLSLPISLPRHSLLEPLGNLEPGQDGRIGGRQRVRCLKHGPTPWRSLYIYFAH